MGLRLTAILILSAIFANAQPLREQAWAAWNAAASHDPARIAPLLDQLTGVRGMANAPLGTEEHALVETLFDALIQLDAPVPADLVASFEPSWRAEILILLTHNASEPVLLALREHPMAEAEWTAVNDLLFTASSLPFFQRTLEEIRVTHKFVVLDPDGEGWGSGESRCCGGMSAHLPEGFPPATRYTLSTSKQPGDKLLLAGPIAVYSRPIASPGCPDAPISAESRSILAAHFFSAIGGLSAEEADHIFRPLDYIHSVAEIEPLLAAQSAAIRSMIMSAQQTGRVQASGIRLPVQLTVEDERDHPTGPLPKIPAHEIVIP